MTAVRGVCGRRVGGDRMVGTVLHCISHHRDGSSTWLIVRLSLRLGLLGPSTVHCCDVYCLSPSVCGLTCHLCACVLCPLCVVVLCVEVATSAVM